MDKVINKIFQKIEKEPLNERLYGDCFDCIKIIFQTDKEKAFEYNGKLRQLCLKAKKETKNWDFIQSLEEIRKESYHLEAKDVFDSYLIYLEWNRPAKKKFYLPRRKQLKTLVEDTSAQFDAREALYYATEDLPAGTYNFSIVTQPWYTADNGKTFQFTLVNDLAAGGQIVLEMTYNQTLAGKSVKVYENSTSTTSIETCTISVGTEGTALGATDGSVENLNHVQRAIMGSNRWSHSAIKQWLNSEKAANSWWTAKNVFDRPSSQVTSAGFLTDMDSEFLAVIGEVNKRTALNTVTDGGGYEDSKELMFLLSRSELYGGLENSVNEGEPYPYYANYSDLSAPGTAVDSNRIKYRNGSAQYWWQRSGYSGHASYVRYVFPTGDIRGINAYGSVGVAPACNII